MEDIDEDLRNFHYPDSITDLKIFYTFCYPFFLIINLYTLIAIYTKSPRNMKAFSQSFIALQIILIFLEFSIFICRPFPFFPHIIIVVFGYFNDYTSTSFQIILLVQLFYLSITTPCIVLSHIFQNLLDPQSIIKFRAYDSRVLIAINIVFAITLIPVFLILLTSDQETNRQYFLENFPWAFKILSNRAACAVKFTWFLGILLILGGIMIYIYFIIITMLALLCWSLLNSKSNLSKQARTVQKKFTVMVIGQALVPNILMLGPVMYCLLSILFQIHSEWNGILNEITIICLSCYTTISSITMICLYPNYRILLQKLFAKTRITKI